MTSSDHEARIAKFVRRAPHVASQAHLEKIIASFAPEHRKIAIDAVSGILPATLGMSARTKVLIEAAPVKAKEENGSSKEGDPCEEVQR